MKKELYKIKGYTRNMKREYGYIEFNPTIGRLRCIINFNPKCKRTVNHNKAIFDGIVKEVNKAYSLYQENKTKGAHRHAYSRKVSEFRRLKND